MLTAEQLADIQSFDTCAIANAIERFGIRRRDAGFARPGLHCLTNCGVRLLGFAAPGHVRSAHPPVTDGPYLDRTDWWTAIERLPVPRIAVIQDLGPEPGSGACVGEVHAAILKAFQCNGVITNGAVRDIPAVSRLGFSMFAPFVSVSHSYVHLVNYGEPVEILGLEIRSGDLLYADCHGLISIPLEIAAELPAVAALMRQKDEQIVQFCLSPDFSAERLLEVIREQS